MRKTVKISFEGKSAPALGLNTIIFKHVYWYMQQISGERLQDHWSSGYFLPLLYMKSQKGDKLYQSLVFVYMYTQRKKLSHWDSAHWDLKKNWLLVPTGKAYIY